MKHFPLSLPQEIEQIGTLHLTGSRYFGNDHEGSDFDYIVEVSDKEALLALFKKHGACVQAHYRLEGGGSVWCYQHPNGDIDFQVVPDVQLKLLAQAWIKDHLSFGFKFPNTKADKDKLWKVAFDIARSSLV